MEKKAKVKDQIHQTKYSSIYREASSVLQYRWSISYDRIVWGIYHMRFSSSAFVFPRDLLEMLYH